MTASKHPMLWDQHARNLECLAENEKRMRSNARYLRWFGWFPMAFMVRNADKHLREVDAELRQADKDLMRFLLKQD